MNLPRSIAVAAGIGIACAAGVATFKAMLRLLEAAVHGWVAPSWGEVGLHPVLIAPVIGGLVVGLLLHLTGMPEEPESSITQTIKAVDRGEQEFAANETPVQAPAALISLTTGAALGPSDPAVGLGATLGKVIGSRGEDTELRKLAVGIGAAAGLSAAFHAPLAAILFAYEVLRIRVPLKLVPVAVAAAISFFLIRFVDDVVEPTPFIAAYSLLSAPELLIAIAIGMSAGVLSALTIRLTHFLKKRITQSGLPRWLRPAMCGVVLVAAGLISSGLLGIGYPTLEKVVSGTFRDISQLAGFAVGKSMLMALSFASGFVGGFFAPSLFVGASLGAVTGRGFETIAPSLNISANALGVVGMAAMLGGMVRAPLTAAILLVEMSNGLKLLPAVLLGAVFATLTSRVLERGSIYTYDLVHDVKNR